MMVFYSKGKLFMRRFRWIIPAIVIVLIIVVAGFIYASHFASTVNTPHTAQGAAKACTVTPVAANSLQTFQIVPAQSTASYSVFENLIIQNKPNNDAIGTTHAIQGSFSIKTGASPSVTEMNITVDLRTLQTDNTHRDDYVRQNALQTDLYPTATFVSTCTHGLPATYTNGQTIQFQLVGNMTLHGKTNEETFAIKGNVTGQSITGTATTTIFMTDFGIQPPNLANFAIAENKVAITINFTAKSS
jgi:polyisoprenoid-binding protein YceI